MRFIPDRVWSLQWFTEVAFPLLPTLPLTINCSATERATFSRGSTPVPSPNPPLLLNEPDNVGLCHFTIPWCSSTISQWDTITGGCPGHVVYPTLYQVTHHLNLTLVSSFNGVFDRLGNKWDVVLFQQGPKALRSQNGVTTLCLPSTTMTLFMHFGSKCRRNFVYWIWPRWTTQSSRDFLIWDALIGKPLTLSAVLDMGLLIPPWWFPGFFPEY